MTLWQAYRAALEQLRPTASEDCAFDLDCLFEHAFGVRRYALPASGDGEAPEERLAAFHTLCARYAAGEPLQYLLGEWEFYGLPFFVGPGVLIPRPDTETLVEEALALLDGIPNPAVADLCAGTGCVGVAIAHKRPDARVYALELSPDAFGYLERNIGRGGVRVTPVLCDVLTPPPLPPLDLVVSNPPYIPPWEMEALQTQVRREPRMALEGGPDGLDFYRALPPLYAPLLKPGGAIAFEVGYNQSEAVCALLRENGYRAVHTRRDLAGIDRVAAGKTA